MHRMTAVSYTHLENGKLKKERKKIMKKQLATLLAVTALGIGVLSGCGVSAASNSTGSSSDSAGAIEITNVSYDPTRELYAAYNDLFAKHWKEEKGQDLSLIHICLHYLLTYTFFLM